MPTLRAADLRRYLEEDITYKAQWKCLISFEETYDFSDCHVLVERLYLDNLALADHFGFEKANRALIAEEAALETAVTRYSLIEQYRTKFREQQRKEERHERRNREKERERKLKELRGRKGR